MLGYLNFFDLNEEKHAFAPFIPLYNHLQMNLKCINQMHPNDAPEWKSQAHLWKVIQSHIMTTMYYQYILLPYILPFYGLQNGSVNS